MKNNILLHDYAGHAFTFELARFLARKGYKVKYLFTSASGGPKGNFAVNTGGLDVEDVAIFKVSKGRFLKRALHERAYGKRLIQKIEKYRPDILISTNTPLLAETLLSKWSKQNQIPCIFWLQDLLSVAARSILSQKYKGFGTIIGNYFERLEKKILERADTVITISDDFFPVLKQWNIDTSKITVIHNWATINDIPVMDRHNYFSKKHKLDNRFVVLYSGTLGMKQNPDLIYQTAKQLNAHPDILFLVVSEGLGADFLNKRLRTQPLSNIKLLPFQSFETLPQLLASADILLTLLNNDGSNYCVPSKVWSGFCSARPAILVVPENNLAARITKSHKAGLVLHDNHPKQLADAVLKLKKHPELRKTFSANARQYAETHFDINRIGSNFVDILNGFK